MAEAALEAASSKVKSPAPAGLILWGLHCRARAGPTISGQSNIMEAVKAAGPLNACFVTRCKHVVKDCTP
jgi:hypothetical protein